MKDLYHLIRKIRVYSLLAFIMPLIAINLCFAIYQTLGSIKLYENIGWDKKIVKVSNSDLIKMPDTIDKTFTNCPKYNYKIYLITKDKKKIEIDKDLTAAENEMLKDTKMNLPVIFEQGNIINETCVKNYPLKYFFLSKFNSLENALINAKMNHLSGFASIKNPYIYGEVSISRTARYYPANLIFKPLIILSALILFLYWKTNLKLLKNLDLDKRIFSKKFFYFGFFSCFFLILHAIFLGLKFDLKFYELFRKSIMVLFIVCEVIAQVFLTKQLFSFRSNLKSLMRSNVLYLKIIFVTTISIATVVSIVIFGYFKPSTEFKHILEWNYFAALLLYYLLTTILWKKTP